jgi:hypothetical protein
MDIPTASASAPNLNLEALPLETAPTAPVQKNLWLEFIGMFEGDAEFAEIAAQLRAEREVHAEGDDRYSFSAS